MLELSNNASPDVVKVLAGNKCDAAYQRAVEAERGEKALGSVECKSKPILWDSGWEGQSHDVASQLTKVSFRTKKNRWITEIVDDASYRTGLAEKSYIAESFDMPFFEVSCKQNINIEEAFLTLARRIREQRNRRASLFDSAERAGADKVDLTKEEDQPGEGWRCAC
ncbi:unnamed protein product [Timema podura]|uniref:Uncharacterized protein n=1 Tax=Timema podura TaxID=61482 RepID=A0ABN7NY20_TIMPD|nr:unnamed protein product [Timema podura]